jgi:hypothetical protein
MYSHVGCIIICGLQRVSNVKQSDMSKACRHCSEESIVLLSSTYISILCHKDNARLEADLKEIENNAGIVPGITVWCEKCTGISIVSYNAYLATIDGNDKTRSEKVMLPTEYYSKMYRFASFLRNI